MRRASGVLASLPLNGGAAIQFARSKEPEPRP
ncbi:UNVERIFIED_ORG: hypothetical protein ABIC62_004897 [Burkholderia sp. 1595]|uniref:Uncharacterized protein n=1 Tax=Paraburkholderia terricola TaxID=169427 RepID=A0ABU1LRY8_9BURK|nr:hypothetical protein [Paraburkholderia terricola]MDR6483942.1 hypothetical protein [Paraburkholderia terricola]